MYKIGDVVKVAAYVESGYFHAEVSAPTFDKTGVVIVGSGEERGLARFEGEMVGIFLGVSHLITGRRDESSDDYGAYQCQLREVKRTRVFMIAEMRESTGIRYLKPVACLPDDVSEAGQ